MKTAPTRSIIAVDIETACAVEGCVDHGKSICRNGHSLSPWHGRITTVGIWKTHSEHSGHGRVFRGEGAVEELRKELKAAFSHFDYQGVVGQNFKFDWLWLAVHGLQIPLDRWVGDSQLAAYVLTEKLPDSWLTQYEYNRTLKANKGAIHRKAGKHSLKTLAPYFLGVEPFWEPEDGNLDNDEYVLKDAEYTARLVVELERRLAERGEYDFYKERLLPWTKMLCEAELRGIEIDMEGMTSLEADLKQRSEDLKQKLDEMWKPAHRDYHKTLMNDLWDKYQQMALKAGYPTLAESPRYLKLHQAAAQKLPRGIDYDSPKQLLWLLRDYQGYDCSITEWDSKLKKEVTKDSTGAKVLERLAGEGHNDAKTLLEWREANKILTSFLPAYRELATPLHEERLASVDESGLGRSGSGHQRLALHPIYNPTKAERNDGHLSGTRTGRLSSERPNAQQIPGTLRPLFKAREGYSLIGYDQAAIEARLIALYSEDPTLYEIVASGRSIHDLNVQVFFGVDTPIEQVKKLHQKERDAAKNVGFALFYHAGAGRIRGALSEHGYHFSKDHCKRLLYKFRDTYAQAFEYARGVVEYMEKGNVLPNLLGRPLRIESPEDCYMQAFNTLVQSSASDLLLEGAHQAYMAMKERKLDAHPLLFVHDFVAFEVKDEHVAEADALIRDALVNFSLTTTHGPIRLEVEGGVSKRWEK